MRDLRLAGCLLASAFSVAAQSPLTTTYANNNGGAVGGAVYFDLDATAALSITGIDVNLTSAATVAGSIDVYTTPTTHVGNETNPAAWTLVGSGTVTSNGAGTPSAVTLAAPIAIPPGPNGYCYVGVGHSFAYTNGNGSNQVYSTSELTLTAGAAVNIAFSGTLYTPRVVNTTITYVTSGGAATATKFGVGCYDRPKAFYELVPVASAQGGDLEHTSWSFLPSGVSPLRYVIAPGPGWVPPIGLNNLATGPFTSSSSGSWDDACLTQALGFAFPYPCGITTDITINSNGKIYLGLTTDPSYATCGSNYGSTATFQNGPPTGPLAQWAPFNTDLDLDQAAGSGELYFEQFPGNARITWQNVPNWQPVAGQTSDVQITLYDSGQVDIAFGSLWNTGVAGLDNTAIHGFSPGDGSPLSVIDWSASVGYLTGDGAVPLVCNADPRPVLGTTVNVTVGSIPPASPLAAVIYGLTKFDPGLDLTPFGLPGCFQYADFAAVVLSVAPGSSVTDPFNVPNDPMLAGLHVIATGAAYNPTAIQNPANAITANGVDLRIDVN